MKNTLLTLALGLLFVGAAAQQAQAIAITGAISMAGGLTSNTGNLSTATAITSFTGVITTTTSGTYAPILPATSVTTTNGFQFLPILNPAPVTVWSFAFLGSTYSFELTTVQSVLQGLDVNSNPFLNISGFGILKATNFDDTYGSYIFSANQGGNTVSFSSSNVATNRVPEGGSAVAMLGMGLLGLAAARKKLVKTA